MCEIHKLISASQDGFIVLMSRTRIGAIEAWRLSIGAGRFSTNGAVLGTSGWHERAAEELLRGADTSNTMRRGKEYYAWQWRAGFRKW